MFKRFGLIRVLARGQALALLLFANAALAEDKEPFAILELGAVAEWGLSGGGSSFGPSAAVEFPVIKNWLEIETGVQKLFSRGQTELDTDLIFKKPFDLSPTVEFEPGVGPVWIHTVSGGRTTNAVGAEVVAHFVFWPTPDRNFGWVLEPSFPLALAMNNRSA
jgi:hypothetical protein